MLNLVFAQHAIACVLCELLCLELFTVFFQHENRFRYKFFRYCSIFKVLCASVFRLTTCWFYHRSGFLSSPFFEAFELFWTWSVLDISELTVGLSGCNPSISLRKPPCRSNTPLGCLLLRNREPSNVYWFFSKASCWDFRSHSFVSALGAQV